jgi:hypothetical protein
MLHILAQKQLGAFLRGLANYPFRQTMKFIFKVIDGLHSPKAGVRDSMRRTLKSLAVFNKKMGVQDLKVQGRSK